REIACYHVGGGNERRCIERTRARDRALVTGEEEQFVLFDRPAKRSAKLIAFQRIPDWSKEIPSVQFVIAHKLERRTVEIVGTRFGDGIDGTTRVESVLSRERTRFNFEFLQGVGEWKRQTVIGVDIVMHTAVERVRVSPLHPSCDAETCR